MRNIVFIILVAIIVKLAYLTFGIVYLKQIENDDSNYIELFKRNDSYWYEKIAVFGHQKITPDQLGKCDENEIEQSYYEFLPLYPGIIGSTMYVFNLDFNTSAFIYGVLFSLTAFILFYIFTKIYTRDEKKAFWSTMILVLFPFHYYYSMFYTESLYLILLIGSFIAIHNKKFISLSILLAFLVLVRPNGLFMTIPLFIYFFEKHYTLKINQLFSRRISKYVPLLAFLSAPVMLFMYCIYLHHMTGDYFAYITARRGWCLYTTFPWEPILRMDNWQEYFKFGYILLFLSISIYYLKKIPFSMHALIWINIILPLTSNMLTLPRFISCIFIFSIIFGVGITRIKWPYKIVVLLILFIGQLYTFTFWLNGQEFSY